jgi:threonine/homoserine/homoserine lactone efflux protein
MEITYWLRGVALGLALAAPVGPIGVLCIRRTLADGRLVGFVTGLGAATADMTYGAVAAFGLTVVSAALVDQRLWIHLIGALFLCYLGVRTALARPPETSTAVRGKGLLGAYASTVVLTLTNPATILTFALLFAGLGLTAGSAHIAAAALTVAGVFCGSALWWLLLSTAVSALRSRVTPRAMRWVNVGSGAILVGFGVVALLTARG